MSILDKIKFEAKYFNLPLSICISFVLFPIIIVFIFTLLIYFEHTRYFALMLLKENSLIENLTFLFLFIGGGFGLNFLMNIRKVGSSNLFKLFKIFLFVCSLALFFVAMEEISWGQQFFKFKTPAEFLKYNAQGELTLHNIKGLQGKSEIFRILVGLIALFGLYLHRLNKYKLFAVPYILSSFVFIILIISTVDLSDDFYPISVPIKSGTQRLSELIEMLIGLFSILYLILLKRKIRSYPALIFNKSLEKQEQNKKAGT